MTVLGKVLINTNDVNILLSNYGSGYTPYVAKAGEDLGRVVLGPGFLLLSLKPSHSHSQYAVKGCVSFLMPGLVLVIQILM